MFTLQWNQEEAMQYREEYAKEQGQGKIIINMLKEHMHLDAIERLSGWTADQLRALAEKNGLAVE